MPNVDTSVMHLYEEQTDTIVACRYVSGHQSFFSKFCQCVFSNIFRHGSSRSCPICRAKVGNSEDSWVILSEKPSMHEMADEVLKMVDSIPAVDPDNMDVELQ